MQAGNTIISTVPEDEGEEISHELIKTSARENDLAKVFELELLSYGIPRIHSLDKCLKLRKLDLSDNAIIDIHGLEKLHQLRSLKLNRNKITVLKNLNSQPDLTDLELFENRITKIEGLQHTRKLKSLRLDRNAISKIENLSKLKALESLDLSLNKIGKIEGLEGLINLRELYLNALQIRRIENLRPLKALRVLQLQSNQIKDARNLAGLPHLQVLLLDDNKFTSLSSFPEIPSLTELYITRNSLASLKGIAKCAPNLDILDVGDNPIGDVDKEVLPSIKKLTKLLEFRLANDLLDKLSYRSVVSVALPSLVVLDDMDLPRLETARGTGGDDEYYTSDEGGAEGEEGAGEFADEMKAFRAKHGIASPEKKKRRRREKKDASGNGTGDAARPGTPPRGQDAQAKKDDGDGKPVRPRTAGRRDPKAADGTRPPLMRPQTAKIKAIKANTRVMSMEEYDQVEAATARNADTFRKNMQAMLASMRAKVDGSAPDLPANSRSVIDPTVPHLQSFEYVAAAAKKAVPQAEPEEETAADVEGPSEGASVDATAADSADADPNSKEALEAQLRILQANEAAIDADIERAMASKGTDNEFGSDDDQGKDDMDGRERIPDDPASDGDSDDDFADQLAKIGFHKRNEAKKTQYDQVPDSPDSPDDTTNVSIPPATSAPAAGEGTSGESLEAQLKLNLADLDQYDSDEDEDLGTGGDADEILTVRELGDRDARDEDDSDDEGEKQVTEGASKNRAVTPVKAAAPVKNAAAQDPPQQAGKPTKTAARPPSSRSRRMDDALSFSRRFEEQPAKSKAKTSHHQRPGSARLVVVDDPVPTPPREKSEGQGSRPAVGATHADLVVPNHRYGPVLHDKTYRLNNKTAERRAKPNARETGGYRSFRVPPGLDNQEEEGPVKTSATVNGRARPASARGSRVKSGGKIGSARNTAGKTGKIGSSKPK